MLIKIETHNYAENKRVQNDQPSVGHLYHTVYSQGLGSIVEEEEEERVHSKSQCMNVRIQCLLDTVGLLHI